jgi:hypothetical protein
VVYLLDCHVCWSQYVGKSVQPFNKRMNGHRSDLTKKTLLPVSQHFVSQALIKKLKNKRFRPFCLWLPGVMFVTCRSKNALFSVFDFNIFFWYRCANILDVYLSFLFVCTVSLTLVSDATSRRFIRWLLFQTLDLAHLLTQTFKLFGILIFWLSVHDEDYSKHVSCALS